MIATVFGPLGIWELVFILVIALLLFGPRRLPEIGRTLGKAFSEFRRASEELKRTLDTEISALDEEERKPARPSYPGLRAAQGTRPRGSVGAPVVDGEPPPELTVHDALPVDEPEPEPEAAVAPPPEEARSAAG